MNSYLPGKTLRFDVTFLDKSAGEPGVLADPTTVVLNIIRADGLRHILGRFARAKGFDDHQLHPCGFELGNQPIDVAGRGLDAWLRLDCSRQLQAKAFQDSDARRAPAVDAGRAGAPPGHREDPTRQTFDTQGIAAVTLFSPPATKKMLDGSKGRSPIIHLFRSDTVFLNASPACPAFV